MEGRISDPEVRYLAGHLERLYEGPSLQDCLAAEVDGPRFRIPLSEAPLEEEKIFFVEEIPVLFPLSGNREWFRSGENGVEFQHDILKSAFYLLSGYQETGGEGYDGNGRFQWENSLQYRLGITGKPVVNYYFEILLDALEHYCRISGQSFRRVEPQSPVLFLSHDIDRIRKYTLRNVVHTFLHIFRKQFGGNRLSKRARIFLYHLAGWVFFRKDPYRNFGPMLELEKELDISSTWFLLEWRGAKNSKYHFTDPEIRALIGRLETEGHEPALHGTLESSGNATLLSEELNRLREVCRSAPAGCRQHFLRYKYPDSVMAQAEAGLIYDASLGFAAHTGFRHSYALPFRLYDFDRKEPMDLWHLPLVAMDVSLLEYMGVPVWQLEETLVPLLEECMRFGGVFSLLWHNCRLDEEEYPGILAVYRSILERILEMGFIPATGESLISELE